MSIGPNHQVLELHYHPTSHRPPDCCIPPVPLGLGLDASKDGK